MKTPDEFTAWWKTATPKQRDAKVAEMVMGWNFRPLDRQQGVSGWFDAEGCLVAYCQPFMRDPGWSPTTSIADAWQVLDWMHALKPTSEQMERSFDREPWVCLERSRDTGEWWAGWKGAYHYEGESWAWEAGADTAPEAICLAACLAKLRMATAAKGGD